MVIDDEPEVYEDVRDGLPGHNVHHVDSLPKVRSKIKDKSIDLAIVDLNIKDENRRRPDGSRYGVY